MSTASDYEKASRREQEAYDRARADADTDLEAYKHALAVARDELDRVDEAMRAVKHNAFLISSSTRARRAHLCKAVDGLTELVKTLGTH